MQAHVNHGAPPRLRLMERGMSYEDACFLTDAINDGCASGLPFAAAQKDAYRRLHQKVHYAVFYTKVCTDISDNA